MSAHDQAVVFNREGDVTLVNTNFSRVAQLANKLRLNPAPLGDLLDVLIGEGGLCFDQSNAGVSLFDVRGVALLRFGF